MFPLMRTPNHLLALAPAFCFAWAGTVEGAVAQTSGFEGASARLPTLLIELHATKPVRREAAAAELALLGSAAHPYLVGLLRAPGGHCPQAVALAFGAPYDGVEWMPLLRDAEVRSRVSAAQALEIRQRIANSREPLAEPPPAAAVEDSVRSASGGAGRAPRRAIASSGLPKAHELDAWTEHLRKCAKDPLFAWRALETLQSTADGALRALEVLIPASSVSALNGDEIMPIESGFYLALRSMAATRAILSDSALATFTGDELARELAWRACAGAPVKSTHLAIWLSHDDARIRTAAVALMLNEPSRCAALLDSVASDPDAQVLAMAKAVRARWLADIPKDQFPQSWAVSRMSPDALVPWMPDALSRLQSSRSVAEIASQVLVRIGSPALQPVRDLVDASAQPPLAALLVLVELGVGDTETLGLLLPYMANGAALEHRFGPLISGRCDEVCAALAPWMADAETVVLAARVWEVGSRYPSWLTSSEVLGPPFCASLEDAAKPVRHSLRKCISDAMRHAPTRATLSASKHADVRSRVLMLLRDFDDSTDVQFVVSSLEDSDPEVAARACALLDRAIGAEAAVDRWQSLWPSMRSAAKERVLLRIVGLGAVAAPLIPRIQEWRESAATQDVHADAALLSAASESVDMDSKEVLAEVERSFRTVLVSTDHSLHLRAIRCLEVSPTLANRYWIPLVAALGGENSNAVSFAVRALHTASEHAQEAEALVRTSLAHPSSMVQDAARRALRKFEKDGPKK